MAGGYYPRGMDCEKAQMTDIKIAALIYYGGKWRLAPWYISHFAPHRAYIDLFGGGANVLLRKERSAVEVYNDLDGKIVNVFSVIQNPATCQQLMRRLKRTPYSRAEFVRAFEPTDDAVEWAARTIIRSTMSVHPSFIWSEENPEKHFSIRSTKNCATHWKNYPRELVKMCKRLEGVTIENMDALKLIQTMDAPDTLFFADPPYMAETRKENSKTQYGYEMTREQHAQLLELLTNCQGNAIICGYDNPLYREKLAGWQMATAKSNACQSSEARLECLWVKRPHGQQTLF